MKLLKKIYSFFAKEKEREQVIILDACALKTQKAMQIIKEASKVVLLYGTIKELDKEQEESTELYIKNKCYILRKSREDVEGEKYLCISGYEKYSYVDDNIIEYCKHHKNTTILTCDNGLCNKAKAFHIPYIFPEDEQISTKPVSSTVSTTQRQEKQQLHLCSENQSQIKVKKEYGKILDRISLGSKGIYITPMEGCYTNYAVTREDSIINASDYKVGDNLYVFRYHIKRKLMKLITYNIVCKSIELEVEKTKEYEIWCLNDIFRLHLPQDLEEQIRIFYIKNLK